MMKFNWIKKALSFVLAGAMVICMSAAAGVPATVCAEETEGGGKYVSDVFIAYAKTEDEAAKWLKDNGWEPVKGDFNAGKASFWDDNKLAEDNVAAVMGIKRTDDKDDAITDMAVMNMTGGYSEPQYEQILKDKKKEIDEFVNKFMVVIEEFRANYNGEGSEFGQKRADMAVNILNTFIDGDPEGEYAAGDTGLPLGDGLIAATQQEGDENGLDLQQIILEGSGPAMLAVETLLALGTDTGEESWLIRAGGLTGDELSENLPKYVPEAEGQDITPSAVSQFLGQKYGDTAKVLADQWEIINTEMVWYEQYNDENGLWQGDDESDEDYILRINDYLKEMRDSEDEDSITEADRYERAMILYNGVYDMQYEGGWGETLGDFFNPADDEFAYPEADAFLPLAAALSDGQRAGLEFLSLQTLILLGLSSEAAFDNISSDVKKIFDGREEFDIYLGVHRSAFRGGVAVTDKALMEEKMGNGQAFEEMWGNTGTLAIASYAAAAAGLVSTVTGGVMMAKGFKYVSDGSTVWSTSQGVYVDKCEWLQGRVESAKDFLITCKKKGWTEHIPKMKENIQNYKEQLEAFKKPTGVGYAGRVLFAVGGVLLIGAAVVSAVRLSQYYDRDMLPIPRMIVDESDIVTYLTDDDGNPILDENGKQKKNIEFNTYEYYEAVACNRPELNSKDFDWNDGVEEYKDHSCYDIADLNADIGQEWVALYTVKSENKGNPILADSLTLQYGKKDMPEGCTQKLHLFTFTNAVDLGDTAWAYNNGKKGVYFFWDADEKAFVEETASTFGTGQLALAGLGGLILGIAGATLVLNKKRRKEEPETADA